MFLLHTHNLFQDSNAPEIKYSSLKAAFKHVIHVFGLKVLDHFNTDDAFKAGQAATQVGVILAHTRRITKTKGKLEAAIEILGDDLKEQFRTLFKVRNGGNSSSSSTPKKRQLRATLSEVSVDSFGLPNMPSSPKDSCKTDMYGFPLTPSPLKPMGSPGHGQPAYLKHADEAAMACSPPPVDKKEWHSNKKPAAAPTFVDAKPPELKKAAPALVDEKPPAMKKAHKVGKCGTGDFVINTSTIKIGGGKQQTYLQHRPSPGANLQLICSVTAKMTLGSSTGHADIINKLLHVAKKPGATKDSVVAARDKILASL
jgi:hypothetical protein